MRFTKMQGVGNDFVVVNSDTPGYDQDPSRLAVTMCDRHFGVGADGLLLVTHIGSRRTIDPEHPAFAMRMFNPDGSEDMCGNGLRCVGLWAVRHGWLGEALTAFNVETKEGLRHLRLIDSDRDGGTATLGVDMGMPRFASKDIPFIGADLETVRDFPLTVGDRVFPVTCVNTGSTHTVIFGPQPSEEEFTHYSPLIEEHPFFPERTSVLWATTEGNRANVRIWERAAGETLGCGTGACAVAVAAIQLGLATAAEPVDVVSLGGTLTIRWPGPDKSVDMVGPATFVFEGETVV